MNDESPFTRPAVMRGYPLDPVEKAALEHALHEVEHSRSNGSGPGALESSEPKHHSQLDGSTLQPPR
jgi:hypothetical protein